MEWARVARRIQTRGICLGGRELPLVHGSHAGQYLLFDEPSSVLHLAASSTTPMAYTFFQILLRHPQLQVNLQDQESGYTALHRALFVGNIRAARDLLLRNDIDTSIKDAEGMAAYDLYNGTVDGVSLVIFYLMGKNAD